MLAIPTSPTYLPTCVTYSPTYLPTSLSYHLFLTFVWITGEEEVILDLFHYFLSSLSIIDAGCAKVEQVQRGEKIRVLIMSDTEEDHIAVHHHESAIWSLVVAPESRARMCGMNEIK